MEERRETAKSKQRRVEHATPEELEGIDRGVRASREGRFATDKEVEEVLASFANS